MAKIIVTGGAGFMGSHTAEELINQGHDVFVLDDLSGGYIENVCKRSKFIQGSIEDSEMINRLFAQEKFEYVYHLAAYAAECLSHFIKRFNYRNNLLGSVNLINAAINHNVRCFVYTSSIAVYGSSPHLPLSEETPAHPEDSYGIAKLAVEQELVISKRMFDLDYIILRPHNVYGERQNIADRYRNVVGIFMNQILQNKPLTVFGDGRQRRAFSYIRDMLPALGDCINVPGAYNQIINLGADEAYTVKDLALCVARAMGVTARIEHLPPRQEAQEAYSSHEKSRRIFGQTQRHTLEEGLSRMAAWVKQYGARAVKSFEQIEVSKNLPPSWL
jgi:UDP-glucose 4-epimerase